MRIQLASRAPSTRRGRIPCSSFSTWWIPSWIAFVWRAVLPEQMRKKSV
jgi:hypothetical protein